MSQKISSYSVQLLNIKWQKLWDTTKNEISFFKQKQHNTYTNNTRKYSKD